jgi:hypothetical protein
VDDLERSDRNLIEEISQNQFEEPRKSTKNPDKNRRCPDQDSKWLSPEYNSRTLPLLKVLISF